MITRSPRLVAVTAVVTTVLLLVVVIVGWAVLKAFDAVGRTEVLRECEYDATASGVQGYCVVVSRYPATPVHSERVFLEIAQVHDGHPIEHRFRAQYPFATQPVTHGDDVSLEVDWARVGERITVTDPSSGASASYAFDQYGAPR